MGGCLKVTGSPLACFHCCAAIPKGVEISELRDNTAICFCCHGCRGAYLLITGASLHDYYLRREQSQLDFRQDAFQNEYNDSQLARHVYSRNGSSAIDIIISGIRCASCVWLNEKIISRLPGVLEARVNYATNRARVSFNPDTITPAAIFSRISQLGYQPRPYSSSAADDHTQREKNDLLIRFGTAFFLTMQLMAYSFALYAGFFQGIGPEMKHFLQIFSLLVTTPVVFYSGWPFLRGAWRGLRNRAPNMELLIAIGAVSAYLYSIMATFSNGEAYYESAAMIVTLILAGRLLENFARQRDAGGLERLLRLTTGEAKRLNGDMVETIDIEDIAAGDMILVASGERIPVDGRISEGSSDIDESPVTGEPLPVVKSAGDQLLAGCINLTGTIRMICKKTVADSFVSRVAHLVEEAQSRRAPIQGIADRTVAWFVPAVLALALATFLWRFYMSGSPEMALMTTLAVVLIACPCALGLATPTAIVAGTGAAAAAGIIFKGGDILERLSRITVVLFDKTGTITHGRPKVLEIQTLDGISAREALALAAAVESGSLHPIGRSICEYASSLSIPFRTGTELRTVAGGGVIGAVDGATVAVGSLRFVSELNTVGIPLLIEPPPGATVVYLAHRGCHIGAISVQDRLREDAAPLVAYLSNSGLRSILVSGDRKESAQLVAEEVGIGQAAGEMTPEDKSVFIQMLQEKGEQVLMVGDGINDAPALTSADVGCAVGGGTDIALESADIVLTTDNLWQLARAHRLARRTMRIIRQNLVWAFAYNLVGIPLAMSGKLAPVYAALAMALSSLFVVANSIRLTAGVKHG